MFQYKSECIEKCQNNTFLDESNFICYDDCKDNIYNNKTFNFKKICVDFDPTLYSSTVSDIILYDSSEVLHENKSEDWESNNYSDYDKIISDITDLPESFKTDKIDLCEKTDEYEKCTNKTTYLNDDNDEDEKLTEETINTQI